MLFYQSGRRSRHPRVRRPEKHLPYLVNSSYFAHELSSTEEKTYFREDTDAMVEAMKKATGA